MKSIGLSYALEGLDNLFLNFDALFYLRIGFVVNNVVTRVLSSLQKKRQIEIFHTNVVFWKDFNSAGVNKITYSLPWLKAWESVMVRASLCLARRGGNPRVF